MSVNDALNDETVLRDTYIFSELAYKLQLGERLNITPKVYCDQYNYDPFLNRGMIGLKVQPIQRSGLYSDLLRTRI
jgi:hypothetical protein